MKYHDLSWNLRSRISKTFGTWKLFTALTADYRESHHRSLLSEEVVPYTSRNLWLGFDLFMQPSKYFTVEANQQYLFSSLSSRLTRGVSFMDVAVSYLFAKYEIELAAHNLLNKRSFEQTLFSSMSESTLRNHFRPREVVAKFMIGF